MHDAQEGICALIVFDVFCGHRVVDFTQSVAGGKYDYFVEVRVDAEADVREFGCLARYSSRCTLVGLHVEDLLAESCLTLCRVADTNEGES